LIVAILVVIIGLTFQLVKPIDDAERGLLDFILAVSLIVIGASLSTIRSRSEIDSKYWLLAKSATRRAYSVAEGLNRIGENILNQITEAEEIGRGDPGSAREIRMVLEHLLTQSEEVRLLASDSLEDWKDLGPRANDYISDLQGIRLSSQARRFVPTSQMPRTQSPAATPIGIHDPVLSRVVKTSNIHFGDLVRLAKAKYSQQRNGWREDLAMAIELAPAEQKGSLTQILERMERGEQIAPTGPQAVAKSAIAEIGPMASDNGHAVEALAGAEAELTVGSPLWTRVRMWKLFLEGQDEECIATWSKSSDTISKYFGVEMASLCLASKWRLGQEVDAAELGMRRATVSDFVLAPPLTYLEHLSEFWQVIGPTLTGKAIESSGPERESVFAREVCHRISPDGNGGNTQTDSIGHDASEADGTEPHVSPEEAQSLLDRQARNKAGLS
jgi:hypothetical protein